MKKQPSVSPLHYGCRRPIALRFITRHDIRLILKYPFQHNPEIIITFSHIFFPCKINHPSCHMTAEQAKTSLNLQVWKNILPLRHK